MVYSKRAKDERWRGPGLVADSIRGQVSVKMGLYYYPCRHADLLKVTGNELIKFKKNEKDPDVPTAAPETEDSHNEGLSTEIKTDHLQLIGRNSFSEKSIEVAGMSYDAPESESSNVSNDLSAEASSNISVNE